MARQHKPPLPTVLIWGGAERQRWLRAVRRLDLALRQVLRALETPPRYYPLEKAEHKVRSAINDLLHLLPKVALPLPPIEE